jgi:PAS domain S-box-containing protein
MLNESLYKKVFNSSPTGNYLLSPTPEAIILAVNDAFLKASGRRREDLVGVSLFVAFPSNPSDLYETGEVVLRGSLARVVASGQPDTLEAIRYPIRVELPTGESSYEERFWNAVSTPIFGEDGNLECISHSTTDVTSSVRAEIARSESETRFRALVDASAEVVYHMGPDWTELHSLEGRGFIPDTLNGRSLWIEAYLPPEDHDRIKEAIEKAIVQKTVFELEHRVVRVDGTLGWAYSRAVPMLDEHGNIYEWIGAASDVTSRKEIEASLLELIRHKDDFLAMLAHELRNPLAPINSAAQLLQKMKLDEKLVQHSCQIISRQVRHMTGLIDDLLDVSRVSRGLIDLDTTPVRIKHILDNAVEQVTPLVQSRRHDLNVVFLHGSDNNMIIGDEKRLVQVMTNLLNNSAKYTPDGGNILVEILANESNLVINVTDNGVGMEPELRTRVFDLFSQGRRNSDRSSGGLGLGLTLVKSLVELHNGSVTCTSPGKNSGSTFKVSFPLFKDRRKYDRSIRNIETENVSNPLTVMVVDDNTDAAQMLAMLLKDLGHQVFVEHSPLQALEKSRQHVPQVFLLDIGLPEMDGKELARQLRARPETSDSILIAITGYGKENDRKEAIAAGFDSHLVKPVDMRILNSLLDRVGRNQFSRSNTA